MSSDQTSTQPWGATASTTAPPPLPTPGSARAPEGPLDLEASYRPGTDLEGTRASTPVGRPGRAGKDVSSACGAGGDPLRTYLIFMAFFTVLWAVGGFGHFWPIYPALGWGLGLVLSGQVSLPTPRRRHG